MNSRWKENLIIFTMALVPTRLMVGSKLGFLVPPRLNVESNLVKVDKNLPVAQVWCKSTKNVIFGRALTMFDSRSTKGWPRVFWSIWPEKALRVFWCPNGLHYVNLDVFTALWRKDNIFGIFEVQHANRRWTKYDPHIIIISTKSI